MCNMLPRINAASCMCVMILLYAVIVTDFLMRAKKEEILKLLFFFATPHRAHIVYMRVYVFIRHPELTSTMYVCEGENEQLLKKREHIYIDCASKNKAQHKNTKKLSHLDVFFMILPVLFNINSSTFGMLG
jgi:hypothetical protein